MREPAEMDRRTVIKTIGAGVGVGAAASSSASATQSAPKQDLRLLGSQNLIDSSPDGYDADGCYDLDVASNYAFAADGEGVAVVDVRNPLKPELVARDDTPGTYVWDAKVDGDLLAVASQFDEGGRLGAPFGDGDSDEIGVTLYDVSDPTQPRRQSHISLPPIGSHNVFVDGSTVYVVQQYVPASNSDALDFRFFLKIYDASDPTDPELLGKYSPEVPGYTVHDVVVHDGLAYLPSFAAGLRIVDVSDPTAPVEVGHWDDPTGRAHYAEPTPQGDVTFVGDEIFSDPFGGIHVLDTSDLSDITKMAFIEPPESGGIPTAHNFDVSANRLDVGWDSGGVITYDITKPAAPEQIARYDPGGFWWGAVQEDGFVLGSDAARGTMAVLSTDNGKKQPPAGGIREMTEPDGHGARGHPHPKDD